MTTPTMARALDPDTDADAPRQLTTRGEDPAKVAAMIRTAHAREIKRFRRIAKYIKGQHDSVYVPDGARDEYRWLMKRSVVNYLPLVVAVIAQNLHVDGFRPTPDGEVTNDVTAVLAAAHAAISQTEDPEEAKGIIAETAGKLQAAAETQAKQKTDQGPWQIFMANSLGSRQRGLFRAVCKYGVGYMVILPGAQKDKPVMRAVSPRRMTALYEDDVDSEWPIYAIEEYPVQSGTGVKRIVRLYDDENVYTMMARGNSKELYWPAGNDLDFLPAGMPVVGRHGLGVCPVIRFLHEIDLDAEMDVSGEVEPLISLQDQINTTTFNILMAQQYAAFRQRWVTGMVPVGEDNQPRAPFRSGVDRLFVAEDPDVKFGEFGQTDLKDYIDSREKSVQHMSTIAQVPPYHMLGLVANLSAEALAAARDGLDRKIEELQGTLTEFWKQAFQLASLAAGDLAGWNDNFGEVQWRDTGARAFAATVDALGKMSQMLGVPATELWAMIPGVSADQVQRWRNAITPDVLAELDKMLAAQLSGGAMGSAPGGTVSPAEPYATDVPRAKGL